MGLDQAIDVVARLRPQLADLLAQFKFASDLKEHPSAGGIRQRLASMIADIDDNIDLAAWPD